ncbi:HAMP domain-containing histidine kinase [Flavobacteriaceae bacterium]|nr:HAMP domain-containing histidine kinase [Flavobacteriaceae bacterium]
MFKKIDKNLAKIDQVKSLAFSIAHETRNPLAGIKGCCELMKNNLNELIEYIDLMHDSSSQGLAMIDIILNNIRDGNIDKSNFVDLSISDAVKKAIRQYAYKNGDEKDLVSLGLKSDFIFKGDENMMIFVIFNLLKNALYYKSKIEIRTAIKPDGNYLYFKDYGPGIEKDKLALIFESFFTSGKKDGTGLGLPFCKRIMTAFEGNIICRSEIGKWTEFEMKFPN